LLYLQTAFSANRDIVNKEVEEFNDWLKQQKVQPILIPETLVDAPIKRKVTEEITTLVVMGRLDMKAPIFVEALI
jgi:glutamyl-tRNA reductase